MSAGSADAFKIVIPARLSSTRLPRKPLRSLRGKPLILHVHDIAYRSGADEVIVATDNEEIAACVRDAGGRVQMTSPECRTGSDRVAESAAALRWNPLTVVVNIQGDEPFLTPEEVRTVSAIITRFPDTAISTLSAPLAPEDSADPHIVKVVTDEHGVALCFSRTDPKEGSRRHLGIYAYRCGYLHRFIRLPVPDAERREKLEQLRALHNGDLIRVGETTPEISLSIDTEDDLHKAEKLLRDAVSMR